MDPITIVTTATARAGAAKSAWDIGETLHTFIRDSRTVDQTVKDLQAEVKSLGDACDMLQLLLRTLSTTNRAYLEGGHSEVPVMLKHAATEYERTVEALGDLLKGVQSGKSSIWSRGWRQLRLNLKKEDILSFRRRIDSHHKSVQLQICVLNLRVSLQPARAADFSTVRDGAAELQERASDVLVAARNASRLHQAGLAATPALASLVKVANQTLEDAETLHEGSVSEFSGLGRVANPQFLRDWLQDVEQSDDESARHADPPPVPTEDPPIYNARAPPSAPQAPAKGHSWYADDQQPATGNEIQLVVALFSYEAEQPGDLSFSKGDILRVLEKTETAPGHGDWWKGSNEKDGSQGIYPTNYASLIYTSYERAESAAAQLRPYKPFR